MPAFKIISKAIREYGAEVVAAKLGASSKADYLSICAGQAGIKWFKGWTKGLDKEGECKVGVFWKECLGSSRAKGWATTGY